MSRFAPPAAALAVLVLAVLVRFTGLEYLLPSLIEPDAHIGVQVKLIESGEEHPERFINWGKYPHLVAWTTVVLTEPPQWGSLEPSASLEEHIALSIAPAVRVRGIVALLSLLALPAAWLIARLYLPPGWRLIAVALTATSLLAVHFGGQGRPHGAAIAFPALAVAAAVWVRRRASVGAYCAASMASGLALACLQSGIAAFLPLGAAHLFAARGRGVRHHLKLLVPLVGFGLALLLFYPFWFTASESGRVEVAGATLDQSGHKINLRGFDGGGLPILVRALASWEPALFAGAAIALVIWIAERARRRPSASGLAWADHAVVLAYVLPYAFVIGLYQRSYERFLIPLVPFLAVFAAWGTWRSYRAIAARPKPLRYAAALALAAWLALPAFVVVRLTRLRDAPSTYALAASWIEAQCDPEQDRILVNAPLILPLYRSPTSMAADELPRVGDRGLMWIEYQEEVLGDLRSGPAWDIAWIPIHKKVWRRWLLSEPDEFMRALKGDYGIVEVFEKGRIDPAGNALGSALDERAQRLARFSPDADPLAFDAPLIYQDETGGTVPWMAWRVLRAERFGAVLQAYRLPDRVGD